MRVHRYYPFSAEQTAVAVNVYRSAHSVPMHRHMFWELFLAVRGTCRHTGAAGETTLLPGDLCAVPPHANHCFEMQDSVEIYNCQCWPEQLNEEERGMLWDVADNRRCSGVVRLPAAQAEYVRQRRDELLREQEHPRENSEAMRRALLTLVLGAGAYGVTTITGGGLEHIVKALGSGGTSDPLNQRATCGWKATKTAERLVEQYMVRIEHSSPTFAHEAVSN